MQIAIDDLRALLRYSDGRLYWLPRTPAQFKGERKSPDVECARWNTRYAGQEAFPLKADGYRRGRLLGMPCSAHRVVFAMHQGFWPDEVDHVDLNKGNNRIENLRAASRNANQHNRPAQANNTSGFKGVGWVRAKGKWRARITTDGRQTMLGYFDTPEEAHTAYADAAERMHGAFARAA